MADCIFCKIARGDIQSDKVYEDETFIGFRDIQPQAPTHIVIIPRKHIPTLNDIPESESQLMSGLLVACQKVAGMQQLSESGYRIVINCNKDGGQDVLHLHAHLLGGRYMGWPPG